MDFANFASDHEHATYLMLKQVCINHLALHHMRWLDLYRVAVSEIGGLLLQLWGTQQQGALVWIPEIAAALHRRVHARAGTDLGFPHLTPDQLGIPALDNPALDAPDDASVALFVALGELLRDAGQEHAILIDGGLRITTALLADVFIVAMQQDSMDDDTVDRLILDILGSQLASYIRTGAPFIARPRS